MATSDREIFVYTAKLAEQAERYDEMVEAMKKVAKIGVELTVEERNLLSVGYKNVIGARRASWRILSSIEQKEESRGNDQNAKRIKEYRQKVELELDTICKDIMDVIDDYLIPSCGGSGEANVFYYKMKGDYHRYMAEFKSGNDRKEVADLSMKAYEAATTTAEAELPPTHPIRLGLALNFSVFYYEILNSAERACHLAKQAFDEAISELDTLNEESYKDSTLIMLSIMGSQVIVEGMEVHNPLSEGSILWITESRSPLGVVDEIFGPVKNPYYVVRFNSETEIPTGIQQGSLISFVPEFADYVLNNNNLYKKGYDASGENDEELSEELEFSDDEKEAEYKRMMKMSKRGSNREKNGRVKKDKKSKNRGGNWKNDQQPSASGPNHVPNNGPTVGPNNGPTSVLNNNPTIGPTCGPAGGPYAYSQASNIPSGVWPFGFPPIQQQNIGFPLNGLSPNVPPFMQPSFIQQPFQNPQFNTTPGQMFPGNFVQGVPPNFGAFASWPSGMPQNNFNQSQMGPPMVFPGLPQGVAMPNQVQMENNNGAVRPFVASGNGKNFQNPNQANTFPNRGGRKPFQRGGGRFRGGRSGP